MARTKPRRPERFDRHAETAARTALIHVCARWRQTAYGASVLLTLPDDALAVLRERGADALGVDWIELDAAERVWLDRLIQAVIRGRSARKA